jgi:hypothetical protein
MLCVFVLCPTILRSEDPRTVSDGKHRSSLESRSTGIMRTEGVANEGMSRIEGSEIGRWGTKKGVISVSGYGESAHRISHYSDMFWGYLQPANIKCSRFPFVEPLFSPLATLAAFIPS